jgi:uncharacterized protein (TIGR03435 family)
VRLAGAIRGPIYGAALLAVFGSMPCCFAQSAATPAAAVRPEFEAASIHMVDPHAPHDLRRGIGVSSESSYPTNLYFLKYAPLTWLIQSAYKVDLQDYIAAMPGWMESQEYDISAKVEGDQQLTLEQMRPMLQRLLEDRFHLLCHREVRMVSGFELVVAKGGAKLQASKDESKLSAQMLRNRMDATRMGMQQFAGLLARHAGQPVVDKTGLTGVYDIRLSYAPDNDSTSSLPDFFTALQEQLGLKLESKKVPVEFLVIDHVDKIPTEN